MELAQYARDVIPHLKEIDKGYALFWYNPDKIYGFRLTHRGFNILKERSYNNWQFQLDDFLVSRQMIMMDQKIKRPYFVMNKRVIFFDEPMAIAMALSNNNLETAINLVYC
jgi:hypothetical protein